MSTVLVDDRIRAFAEQVRTVPRPKVPPRSPWLERHRDHGGVTTHDTEVAGVVQRVCACGSKMLMEGAA